uniref:Chitin-binding type-2 domain-containing protein n=1 Tax=Clytia hemisphaerica TaxID=252671 RepID=A0A7M5XHW7_9CNID
MKTLPILLLLTFFVCQILGAPKYQEGRKDKYAVKDAPNMYLRSPIENGDACKYLTDGNYAIRDVFKYLQCKDNKGTFVPCEEKNTIFDSETGKCIDIKTKTPETFCQGRTNNDWVNPWDCHGFFKCWYNTTHQFKCQLPELVFNPYTNQCNYKEKYACKEVCEQQGKTKTKELKVCESEFYSI